MSAKMYDKDGQCLIENLEIADTFTSRIRGLLGRKYISKDYGLLLLPCGSIHMFFMKFPIDVFFLKKVNGGFEILKIVRNLTTWRLCFAPPGTCAVLEVSPTALPHVKEGDKLRLEPHGMNSVVPVVTPFVRRRPSIHPRTVHRTFLYGTEVRGSLGSGIGN